MEEALKQYTLQGVGETGVELGRGSYAAVYAVEYKGLKCAAKKLHQTLYQQGIGYAARRFQEECAILSRLRHPNIVQFLGVYHQPGSILPALVMEYLPMTLVQCLDKYGVLQDEIGYSILKDVALALSYLHQHDPPIIHRDLSANNVLLTHGMIAKISDLGVAKMLDLSPTQVRTMTQTPGTPCYMPPEVLVPKPSYSTKVDVFAFGVLMVHLFTGQWPFPTEAVKMAGSQMIPQSEADRRQEKLDAIGGDHPLMTLMLRCLHNSPASRPEAVEILRKVSRTAAQFLSSSAGNKVELLKLVSSLRAETERLQQTLEVKEKSYLLPKQETKPFQVAQIEFKAEKADEESQRKLEDAERCHSVEVEQLNLRLADTRDTLSSRVGEVEAELRAAQQQISSKNSALSDRDNEVAKLTGQMAELRQEMVEKDQRLVQKENEFVFLQRRVEEQDQKLRKLKEKEAETSAVLRSQEVILSSKESLVASKDSIIGGLQEQLDHLRKSHTAQVLQKKEVDIRSQRALSSTSIRVLEEQVEYLSVQMPKVLNFPPKGAKIKWERCKDMPSSMSSAQAVVVGTAVYVGGGETLPGTQSYTVLEFIPAEDKWSTLPPAPVRLFGLGELNGQLVIVGGKTRQGVVTRKVHSFDKSSKKWKESIPPMPTARYNAAVFSQPSCLTVVGGRDQHEKELSDVEVFVPQTSQWYKTLPSPSPLSLVTTTVIHNKCFLTQYDNLTKVYQLCVSVHLATATTGSSVAPQVTTEWRDLPELPNRGYALGSLNGCLLEVGGWNGNTNKVSKSVYAFSTSSNSYARVAYLPDPRCKSTAVSMATGELLVMGGYITVPTLPVAMTSPAVFKGSFVC